MAETTNLATQRAQGEAAERSAEEIRQDIAAKRETISETVDKLSERIHQTLDWREYVGQYPIVALGVAAGVGFLVAGIFKHRPTPQERIADAIAELTEDLTDRISDIAGDTLKKKFISGKTVKAAITGVITKAAIDYAKGQVGSRLLGTGNQNRNEQAGYQSEQTGQVFQSTRPL
jgi:ElaB/YqjD/DUF883 family membrane-anchored ribosome-binding protein